MLQHIKDYFYQVAPKVDFCSLRFVSESSESLAVRQNIPQPIHTSEDRGVMLTVYNGGGMGYAATSDLTLSGLHQAVKQACDWAHKSAAHSVVDFRKIVVEPPRGEYIGPQHQPWNSQSLSEKMDLLQRECERLKTDPRIVNWGTFLWHTDVETLYLTTDGGYVHQSFSSLVPRMTAVANSGSETQSRSLGGHECRQGGLEVLEKIGFLQAAPRIADEALQLLTAPNCPSDMMDVLLAPDQMILQIHESIGHPLELDRILGDERNYAGTSFVTPDMFGSYPYGSDLLNITFDPTQREELASYGFDDEGLPAKREYLIQDGILQRALGGFISQMRVQVPGVANSRACSWNRPPIDRMANLNLEPGESSLDQMIESVQNGIYMKTNCSWSIDDSRNKFQFGCEWGQLIKDGRLTTVVKKPNYRGISATFWRNLAMVGNRDSFTIMGSPFCGKGEPNQAISVGHASPACLFTNVDVFGGE